MKIANAASAPFGAYGTGQTSPTQPAQRSAFADQAKSLQHRGGRAAAAILHRYPLYAGCGRISNSKPFRRLAAGMSPVQWASLRCDMNAVVDVRDFVGRAAYFFGALDPKIDWVCKSVLRPGDRCIDIGANVGLVSLLAARYVGPAGHVYSVEPQPAVADMLRLSARRNDLQNITVYECALSDTRGTAWLHVPPQNSGMASLSELEEAVPRVRVDVYAADEFLVSLPRRIRLVKIDVEGHEEPILARFGGFLARARPDCIIFECRDASDLWSRPGIRVLLDHGYDLFGLTGLTRPRLRPVSPGQCVPDGIHDLVALPHGFALRDTFRINRPK